MLRDVDHEVAVEYGPSSGGHPTMISLTVAFVVFLMVLPILIPIYMVQLGRSRR